MATIKGNTPKKNKKTSKVNNEVFLYKDKTLETSLDELIFDNVDYNDIDKLKKLHKLNQRKMDDIIKVLKECIKESI